MGESKGEMLVDDGSIIKVLIQSAPADASDVCWEKGMNAKFHYTAHAYVVDSTEQKTHSSAACSHGHNHSHSSKSNCSHGHETSTLQSRFNEIADLIPKSKGLQNSRQIKLQND